MAFKYCKSCGYKNIYTLNPPNFCAGCGDSFDSTHTAKASKAKKSSVNRGRVVVDKSGEISRHDQYEDFDPDGLDVWEVPKIKKLSYSVEIDERNKLNLSDLIDIEEFQEFNDEEEKPKTKPKAKRKAGRPRRKKS